MSSSDGVLLQREGAVGWLRINRPERLNAFAGTMRDEIHEALLALEQDDAIRCVIITGVGRAFSTGGDINVMSELIEAQDRARFEELVRAGVRVVSLIDEMSKPVIAAINGVAAGAGACLALACDLRIASESAVIGLTFLRVGLHPDWGGSYFLPRLVGAALAAELIYTGEMISAERAERLGIINRVVPARELEQTARALAGQIAAQPVVAVRNLKRAMRQTLDASLEEMLEYEVEAQLAAFDSPDFREGITAFLEKRAPRFGKNG